MRRKLAAIVAGAMMVGNVIASDVKMTPMFDISYMHSNSTTSSGLSEGLAKPNASDDIDVQYAGLAFSGSSKSLDWYVSANLAGDAANGGTTGPFINEAYLKHGFNDSFSVMAGRFFTFVGYEGEMASENWNYTKSIAKTVSPTYHEGLGFSFDAKNGLMATLYVLDAIEDTQDSSSTAANGRPEKKAVGATVSYSMDKWKASADYYKTADASTDEDTVIYGFNFKYDVTDQFSAAVAGEMGKSETSTAGQEQKFSSWAAYLKFKATEKFFAALRYEMFNEDADTAGDFWYSNTTNFANYSAGSNKDNDLTSLTLTAGYDFMNGSVLKLEYRMDSSDRQIYTNPDSTNSTEEDSNNTVALAWLFSY